MHMELRGEKREKKKKIKKKRSLKNNHPPPPRGLFAGNRTDMVYFLAFGKYQQHLTQGYQFRGSTEGVKLTISAGLIF